MKKLLVVLLSLGLIAAFCAPASAVEVKISGEFYTYGIYYANRTLVDEEMATSRAWFYTQTRLAPVFQIAEGLKFTLRADMISKFWGVQNMKNASTDDKNSSKRWDAMAAGPADIKMQENIELERGYLTADTAYGVLDVGYMSSGTFGPDFGNDNQTRPRIKYATKVGPVTVLAVYEKTFEADHTNRWAADPAVKLGQYADADNQNYNLAGVFGFEGGEAGLLYKYVANNSSRPAFEGAGEFKTKVHALDPYVTMAIGPVEIEAEFMYQFGKVAEFDNAPAGVQDVDKSGWGGFLKAKANLGPMYVGGMFLYSSGDDISTPDKDESGPISPDAAYGYIVMKDYEDSDVWQPIQGTGQELDDSLNNVSLIQAYAGFDPTEKLNVQMQFIWAKENEDRVVNQVSNDIGYELGAEATYKIFDNLSYKVAAAYFWAGDLFKGANTANEVGNDYMLYNKLTLEW